MLVNRLKSALITTAAAGALFVGLGTGPAAAAPIFFEWAPGAMPGSTATDINGTGFKIADFATINLPSQGGFVSGITERAFLVLDSINGADAGLVNYKGVFPTNTANFQIWFDVTATSHLTFSGPNDATGAFDTLTYNMYGDVGGDCTFSNPGTPTVGPKGAGTCSPVLLAHGALTGPVNEVNITGGVPGAGVDTSMIPDLAAFFVIPPPTDYIHLLLDSAFTNDAGSVVSTCGPAHTPPFPGPCTILLGATQGGLPTPGGGSASLIATPEPGTLSMFGMGLLGLGWMFRRRNEKAANA